MSDLLTFDNVWLEYGDKIVLERVDLGAERKPCRTREQPFSIPPQPGA